MKILQWSMTIPVKKQVRFEKWFNNIAGPVLGEFGAKKHEIHKVVDKAVIGRQTIEKNRYIERIYFDDNVDISGYFAAVKTDPNAWNISRMYEGKFGAREIELRVLQEI